MAVRRLNVVNAKNLVNYSLRFFSSYSIALPEETVTNIVKESHNIASETSPVALKKDAERLLEEIKNETSSLFIPAVPQKSETFAAYVSKSELLQNMIKLGVDLSKIEKDPDMADYLVKSDFKLDIQPYILFLYDHKVNPADMGNIFTKCPSIFKEPLDRLQLRIDYFKSKNFSDESVIRIITKVPSVLTTSTLITDKQLGFLQKTFGLRGDELREVVTKLPKLIVWEQDAIRDNKMYMMDTLGFEAVEVKQMLFQDPRLLVSGKFEVASRFDYVHNTIGLSHEEILLWPSILRTRLHIIKERHQFLKFIGKDTFDRKLENYVSMKALVSGSDSEFCEHVAKVPVQVYNDYMKSM